MGKIKVIIIIIVLFVTVIAVIAYFLTRSEVKPILIETKKEEENVFKLVDFSKINSELLFSANIPKDFKAEYIPTLRAVNIYNSAINGESNIEKSQIYISFFRADKFLTLNTVNISLQEKTEVKSHEAVLYEITKKEGLPSFLGQPSWRNYTHKAIDIRLNQNNPTYFYSFAYNPELDQNIIDKIMASLVFNEN